MRPACVPCFLFFSPFPPSVTITHRHAPVDPPTHGRHGACPTAVARTWRRGTAREGPPPAASPWSLLPPLQKQTPPARCAGSLGSAPNGPAFRSTDLPVPPYFQLREHCRCIRVGASQTVACTTAPSRSLSGAMQAEWPTRRRGRGRYTVDGHSDWRAGYPLVRVPVCGRGSARTSTRTGG